MSLLRTSGLLSRHAKTSLQLGQKSAAALQGRPARALCAAATEAPAEEKPAEVSYPNRHVVTAEVIVSKIFPAGFGWQASSIFAGQQGFEADTLSFALTTGVGDFLGVFIGHTTYSLLKAAVVGSPSIKGDMVAGLWLASAAFCSGTAWQPTVNLLHDAAHLSFVPTMVGCGAVTGMAFFGGLRLGRIVYKPLGLPGQDYESLIGDAKLSISIGAATGCFVGTDISFAAGDNFLQPLFGVTDSMSDLQGCVTAGASTAFGFGILQTAQNIVQPKGVNWIDPISIK